jgi:hypothetical protein
MLLEPLIVFALPMVFARPIVLADGPAMAKPQLAATATAVLNVNVFIFIFNPPETLKIPVTENSILKNTIGSRSNSRVKLSLPVLQDESGL